MKKSLSQTPAPKKDRIYGSKVNAKGSASSEKSASEIKLSATIIAALTTKLKEFREKHSNNNITLNDLKAVYRRGLGAYSTSHRPNITRNAWAMARVNKFLLKAGGTKVKAAYVQDDDLMKYDGGGATIGKPIEFYQRTYADGTTQKISIDDYEKNVLPYLEKGGALYLAPNGKPSNLTPEQYKLVRTPEFKAWFGDWEKLANIKITDSGVDDSTLEILGRDVSKVIDDNGEPLVVYHGTDKDFNVFDKKYIKKGNYGFGFYFTPSYKYAEYQGKVLSCFLNIRNPEKKEFSDKEYGKRIKSKYDGQIISNELGLSFNLSQLVVKNSNQIKLADGTNTTFNSKNPDIRYENGGVVAEYIKNIEVIGDDEEGILYSGRYGNSGVLSWINYGEVINVITIESGNKKGSSGTMAIASLFLLNPKVQTITYQDNSHFEDGTSFWVRIGGDYTDLERSDFFNYFQNKFGYNPDIRFDGGGMTYRQYADTQFNEEEDKYLPEDYFEPFKIEEGKKEEYPTLVKEQDALQYRKWKFGGIGVFDGEKMVAFADNGSIQVSPSYQKRGIGLELVTILKEMNPNHRFGNMTPQGFALMENYYNTKIATNPDIRYEKGGEIKSFFTWFHQWYKGVSKEIDIMISLPNAISGLKPIPYQEENAVILDMFRKKDQKIDAKPYLQTILDKADEYGITIYFLPDPNYIYIDDVQISREYLIDYYKDFGFELIADNEFMKREYKYAKSGDAGQEIKCRNCGWRWNTKDSEEYDKYVCHKCGFDNRTYYDADPIGYKDGGQVNNCKEFILQNKSVLTNGFYFNMNDLSKLFDPYGQVPTHLDFTLVSYNSGGQSNLDVIDTINPTTLVDRLSELLDLEKNQSYVVVNYVIANAKRLTNINQITTEKIVVVDIDMVVCENLNEYAGGGEVDDKKKVYDKWKSLVNMSYGEIKRFYESKEGKEAGLSSSEAKEQGISSGRESARMLMKMKLTSKDNWTPTMWKWANKQISFISRMRGMQGELYDDNGNKTRKHTSLLIWGHNPKKYSSMNYADGGWIDNKMELYHGGNLDEYNDIIAQKSGRYEYGAGLYLTSHLETALKYAKGSRKLYKITVRKGRDIHDATINFDKINTFIKKYVIASKRKEIVGRTEKYNVDGKMKAYIFNNIILNEKAVSPSNTKYLRNFLIENGVDYEIVDNPFGWGETMIVLYNMDNIVNVEKLDRSKLYADGGEMDVRMEDTVQRMDNPNFADISFYKKGGELKGLTQSEVETNVKKIAYKFKLPLEYVNTQLKLGVKFEMEHTKDKSIASKIAIDHLEESPYYYQKLTEMEKELDTMKMDADTYLPKVMSAYKNGGEVDMVFKLNTPTKEPTKLNYIQQVLVRTTEFKKWFGDWEKCAESFIEDNKSNFLKHYKNCSIVIDLNTLEPQVTYHGTNFKEEFYTFDVTKKEGVGRPYGYFADNIEYSENFTSSSQRGQHGLSLLYKCFLNIKNPFMAIGEDFYNEIHEEVSWSLRIAKQLAINKYGVNRTGEQVNEYLKIVMEQIFPYMRDTFQGQGKPFWILMARDTKKEFKYFLMSHGFDGVRYAEEFKMGYDVDNRAEFTKAWTIFDANQTKLADGRNIDFDPFKEDIRYEEGGSLTELNQEEMQQENMSKAQMLRNTIGINKFAEGGTVKGDGKHTNDAKNGGFFEGRSHAEGGIKAINKDTGQMLEVEGNEVIINKRSVADGTKREFEGKMMTNREILSKINEMGGGVSFEEGGEINKESCKCMGKKYKFGGNLVSDYDIVKELTFSYNYEIEKPINNSVYYVENLIYKINGNN
jgi:GNAT superfamily N-acetyltransferase